MKRYPDVPLSFCPYVNLGDSRCLPAKLSSSNLDKVIETCAFAWKDCAIYKAISEERSAVSGRSSSSAGELDTSIVERLLESSVLDEPEEPSGKFEAPSRIDGGRRESSGGGNKPHNEERRKESTGRNRRRRRKSRRKDHPSPPDKS